LENVVSDKSGDTEGFTDIVDIQNRFKSLKNENDNLRDRKAALNKETEDTRKGEKTTLNRLKNELYDYQRQMQHIHAGLEEIASKNQDLEQDFENEINKKN